MREQNITINHHGRNIAGRAFFPEKRTCPFVVFSHGFNGSGDDFRMQAEVLAENGIGAFTFDFCGGALTSKSDMHTYEMTDYTEKEDLLSVLDTVKTWQDVDSNNIFLFGASMGGLVSALAAEEREDDIRGMILLYPAFCVADNWKERFPGIDDIPQRHDVWGVPLGKCFFEALHDLEIFANIGNYSGIVLLMHGDRDDTVPVEYSVRAREIYRDSHLEIFAGEGHGFSAAGTDKVTQMLVDMVSRSTGI